MALQTNTRVTLRRLIYEISEWANAHQMIKKFDFGDFLDIYEESKNEYPYLMVNTSNGSESEFYTKFSLEICCMDWVWDNRENQKRVESDMEQIVRDFYNTANYSARWQSFCKISGEMIQRKFIEKGGDKVTGWCGTINIWIKKRSGFCDLEAIMPEYDFESGEVIVPGCAPATYANSDDSFEVEIQSGSSFVAPDINVQINGSDQGDFPANQDIDITVDIPPVVYYNRPWIRQLTTFRDHDEGWRRQNPGSNHSAGGNSYNASIPDTGVLQQIDYSSGLIDRLKYFNVWGHKFLWTGINGGYYNPDDGNFYDKDGNLSDKATEFPIVFGTHALIINHLNGYMMLTDRGGAVTWDQLVDNVPSYNVGGFTDWFVPTYDELHQTFHHVELIDAANFAGNEPRRSQFNYSQPTMWSGTTRLDNSAQGQRFFTNSAGGFKNLSAKTNTGANRTYFRLHLTGTIPQP